MFTLLNRLKRFVCSSDACRAQPAQSCLFPGLPRKKCKGKTPVCVQCDSSSNTFCCLSQHLLYTTTALENSCTYGRLLEAGDGTKDAGNSERWPWGLVPTCTAASLPAPIAPAACRAHCTTAQPQPVHGSSSPSDVSLPEPIDKSEPSLCNLWGVFLLCSSKK